MLNERSRPSFPTVMLETKEAGRGLPLPPEHRRGDSRPLSGEHVGRREEMERRLRRRERGRERKNMAD